LKSESGTIPSYLIP